MINTWSAEYAASAGEKLLKQSCMITRTVSANDGSGGVTETDILVGHNVPCALVNKRMIAPMNERSGRVASQYEMILYVAADQEIAANDNATVDGEVFRVQNVVIDHQWPVYSRCTVERVD